MSFINTDIFDKYLTIEIIVAYLQIIFNKSEPLLPSGQQMDGV